MEAAADILAERCCARCSHYTPPRAVPGGYSAQVDAVLYLSGDLFTHGDCRRYPKTERKRPTDRCGEFASGGPSDNEENGNA